MEYRGLTGLVNLGNTCFINSAIQCLSHTKILNKLLKDKIKENKVGDDIDSILLKEWIKLYDLMWSSNCIIKPGRFLLNMKKVAKKKNKELFLGFQQNDIAEFLIFCFDCFHESLKREVDMKIIGKVENETDLLAKKCYKMIKNIYNNKYSEIVNLFYGIHISKISSLESEYLNNTPEPFIFLNLEICGNDLYDCIDNYTKEELLPNKIEVDEKTKKRENVKKKILFWSLPEVLIITLKLFNNDGKKISNKIDIPLNNLDLNKYVIGYDKNNIYDLYGMCNHLGNRSNCGHYTSYIKVNNEINDNEKWFCFDDMKVKEITVNTNNAYCLFYSKKK